jgi:pimeloyl-ACP methyl ester carboxylesterase
VPRLLPDLPGVTHRFVALDGGLRLHVAEAGGDGRGAHPPVVLLHGWPQHWWCFRHVIGPLAAAGRRVVAPDLRGFGWSDAPDGPYAKEQLAGDVLALLDALGLDRVDLAGHDWGGWIGMLVGLRAAHRVRRLVALAIATPWPVRHPGALRHAWRFAYQPAVGAPGLGPALVARTPLVATLLRAGAADPERRGRDDVDPYVAALREPARARASSALYRTFLRRELPAVLAGRYTAGRRLAVPTLLMLGSRDPVVRPDLVDTAHEHADDLTTELVADAGHWLPEEQPALVADRILGAV